MQSWMRLNVGMGEGFRAPLAPAPDESEVPSSDAFGAVLTRACQSSALGRAVVMRSIERRRTSTLPARGGVSSR